MARSKGKETHSEKEMSLQVRTALKALRVNRGLTQEAVADFLGISRPAYTYYELGTTSPSSSTLYRLSQFYGVSPDVFFVPGAIADLHPETKRVRKRSQDAKKDS